MAPNTECEQGSAGRWDPAGLVAFRGGSESPCVHITRLSSVVPSMFDEGRIVFYSSG